MPTSLQPQTCLPRWPALPRRQVRHKVRKRLLDLSIAHTAVLVDVQLAEEPLIEHPTYGRVCLRLAILRTG